MTDKEIINELVRTHDVRWVVQQYIEETGVSEAEAKDKVLKLATKWFALPLKHRDKILTTGNIKWLIGRKNCPAWQKRHNNIEFLVGSTIVSTVACAFILICHSMGAFGAWLAIVPYVLFAVWCNKNKL